jgi:hypothetical protein
LTASPDTKLADAHSIIVTGAGFSPNTQISIAECKAGATGQAGCDLSTVLYTASNGSGSFTAPYSVSRILTTTDAEGLSESTDCALDPSILGAADTANLAVAAVTGIKFNPKIPPVFRYTVASTDKVNTSTGVADIAGTFTCRRPLSIQIYVDLDQHRGRFNTENEGFDLVNCTGHKKWTVAVAPGFALFGAGKATVDVSLSTRIVNSFRNINVSTKIDLESGAK